MASRKQQRIDPNRAERLQVPARLEEGVRIPREARATDPASKTRSGKPGGRPPTAPKIRKAGPGDWIAGARLRTLPLSIAPVILGTAAAHTSIAPWAWWRIALALAVAVCLQIGVNYANDYSDGVRGTDKYRLGPSRLTGSGAAKPRTVLTVAIVFFALAALALLADRMALLAACLLTAMLVSFGLVVWVPMVLSNPHSHVNWSENSETFEIAGAVWILADLLGEYRLNEHRPR